uniref:Uncharacterized protein n=1 Tax=Guillardia theta TaxID=55529 RepID=A0A7S4K9T2_GUITH|mmetsp:Transcript_22191/g.73049  ORF Transcript_22191/g.73049 Transcript_22191/m.73049 type:complete len:203 (+) Transcript_22191:260-868(+)
MANEAAASGGQVLFSNNPLLRVIDKKETISLARHASAQPATNSSELNDCKCDHDRVEAPAIFACPSLSCPQPPSPGPRCTTMAKTDCESPSGNLSSRAAGTSTHKGILEGESSEQTEVFNKDDASQRLKRTLHRVALLRQQATSPVSPQKPAQSERNSRDLQRNDFAAARRIDEENVSPTSNPLQVQADLSDFICNLPLNIM